MALPASLLQRNLPLPAAFQRMCRTTLPIIHNQAGGGCWELESKTPRRGLFRRGCSPDFCTFPPPLDGRVVSLEPPAPLLLGGGRLTCTGGAAVARRRRLNLVLGAIQEAGAPSAVALQMRMAVRHKLGRGAEAASEFVGARGCGRAGVGVWACGCGCVCVGVCGCRRAICECVWV